jgi:hypothetical protein
MEEMPQHDYRRPVWTTASVVAAGRSKMAMAKMAKMARRRDGETARTEWLVRANPRHGACKSRSVKELVLCWCCACFSLSIEY